MIDLKKVAEYISNEGLWGRPLNALDKEEIVDFINYILSSPDFSKVPPNGWELPYLNNDDELVIPFNSHPTHQYWKCEGQSIIETLQELGASEEVMTKNIPTSYRQGILKNG